MGPDLSVRSSRRADPASPAPATAASAEALDWVHAQVVRAGMPPSVEAVALSEVTRLRRGDGSSDERLQRRTWLDWMIDLPWRNASTMPADLEAVRAVLEADHHGRPEVKRHIAAHLAAAEEGASTAPRILCFAGAAGVGKTALAQGIARALGRPFVRISLAGVHSEAEMRGDPRGAIGALPGHIVQAVRRAGSRRCVVLLDHADGLMGRGTRGDPSAALLEALDPWRNAAFRDDYLGVPFDLRPVMFIASVASAQALSRPLRHLMDVVELPGYTAQDKLEIARRFLVPRQRQACGLGVEQVDLDEQVLRRLVQEDAGEAGVHRLEREIGRLMRDAAARLAATGAAHLTIRESDLLELPAPPASQP